LYEKKVAIMIPHLRDGGAERVVSILTNYLFIKYNIYLILFDGKNRDYECKGKIIDLEVPASKSHFKRLIRLIKRILKVKKLKELYQFDVIISFLNTPNIINLLTRQKEKRIISVRDFTSIYLKGFYGRIFKMLIKLLYNRADKIIAVSKAIKIDLVENFNIKESKIEVIYNPYNIESIQASANEDMEEVYKDVFNGPVVINVGRLTRAKGQWHLIRAFKLINEKIPDMRLIIMGKEEDLEEYLKNLVRDLNLDKAIHLMPFQKNPFKYVARSKIYAFPSLFEGFPNALVEAMACGIPVIACDCKSGPREILAPDTDNKSHTKTVEYAKYGILVPICDGNYYKVDDPLTCEETLLAHSIIELYQSPELSKQYAESGQRRAEELEIRKIISQYESIID